MVFMYNSLIRSNLYVIGSVYYQRMLKEQQNEITIFIPSNILFNESTTIELNSFLNHRFPSFLMDNIIDRKKGHRLRVLSSKYMFSFEGTIKISPKETKRKKSSLV